MILLVNGAVFSITANGVACSWWRMRLVDSATCYKRLLTAVYFTEL